VVEGFGMFVLDKLRGSPAVLGWFCGLAFLLAMGSAVASVGAVPTEPLPLISTASSASDPVKSDDQNLGEPETLTGQPDQVSAPDAVVDVQQATSAAVFVEPPSKMSDDAGFAAHWVIANADNHGQPFAIIDKKGAHLYVFASTGQLTGESSVLLGLAAGDRSIAGIATRTPASLAPSERTTPAGRFASEPGHNTKGEDIVWFDYDASLAIHRLRPAPAGEHRADRLASTNSDDKRISYGCIVVPVAFYDAVVSPALGRGRGVVYVLPETRSVRDLFGSIELSRR
jgi:hypothetical protein